MSLSAQERLRFIEASLLWRGSISRRDLCTRFQISESRASLDLSAYQKACQLAGHKNLEFDTTQKVYHNRHETFFALYKTPSLEEAQNMGVEIPHESPPLLPEPQDLEKRHQLVLQAAAQKFGIHCHYLSPKKGSQPLKIFPHHTWSDGISLMVRAYCPKTQKFRNFSLRRIQNPEPCEEAPNEADPAKDTEWNEREEITLFPAEDNPETVTQEFSIPKKGLKLNPRACQAEFIRMRLGLKEYPQSLFQEKNKEVKL